MTCIFCEKDTEKVIFQNEYAKAFYDEFPVNQGHVLIVPKAHREHYFELSQDEVLAILELLHECRAYIAERFQADGFNIGWNCGEEAGQSVFHAHCHLIPRYKGDVDKPKGGIRNFKEALVKYD
ncbi:HIT family protein (plasmid) [Pontibacillus sp. ALD_SL1]|uniref:HIT family protein n=1 Tax=Pontibacillus sp. ALD_SL1 TaxID=2777185 RepID=UPI001A975ABD|nr:HIT family protein [Pontibacillus sp. ALD_SL1]QST02659.1 HIT family protein [Pontibacillus sp. ALD_SL1]